MFFLQARGIDPTKKKQLKEHQPSSYTMDPVISP